MKQTNNAIKFLMAQYRAIFQNAYFKGLATAAVVTMGLAAGQAQAAADDAVLEVGDSVTVATKTITIDGKASTDGTATGIFKNVSVSDDTLDLSGYTLNIEAEDGTAKNKITAGSNNPGVLNIDTVNISIGQSGKTTDGLSVEGTADNTASLSAKTIAITKGTLTAKGATNAGAVNVNSLTIGGESVATPDDANLAIGALGTVGYALEGNGSSDTAPTGDRDVANYTTVNLDKNSKLAATASANNTILNAAELSINGGKIDVAAGSDANDNLTINLAKGELKDGTIKTIANGVLNIKFAEGDFVKDGTAVEKTLTLTKGTLDLTGGMTLSGEGKLVVTDKLDELTVTAAGEGITLTEKAAFAPTDVANAKAVAAKEL